MEENIFTLKHSWPGHILGEHWRQRRHRLRTRRRWPWCRRLEEGSSVCWLGWWTWPARWSPLEPPWLALPCGRARKTSKRQRQSSCKAHTLSPRKRRADAQRGVQPWDKSRRQWQWWRRSICCRRRRAWSRREGRGCRRAGPGSHLSKHKPGRSLSSRLRVVIFWQITMLADVWSLIRKEIQPLSFLFWATARRRSYPIQYLIDPLTLVLSSHC